GVGALTGLNRTGSEVETTGGGGGQGGQKANVARCGVLGGVFRDCVPATTVDRQCGSSQQAVHFAAQGVLAGSYDIVIACGVESMTRVPMGSSAKNGPGKPFGPAVMKRYNNVQFNQGLSAEMLSARLT